MSDTDDTDSVSVEREQSNDDQEALELMAAEKVDMAMRQMLAAQLGENIHGDNDYYDVFSWDKNPDEEDFYALALRNPYAFAVTFLPAMTSWRDAPDVVDDADSDGQSSFESDVEDVVSDQKLWHYGARGDMLAGIGKFGVLVLQFDDIERADVGSGGKNDGFAKPVGNAENLSGVRPFSQTSISDVVLGGPASGRWGDPLMYELDLDDENDDDSGVTNTGPDTMWVHHSRVIHIHSDQLLDDEWRGIPRQQPVYNNLIDIEKTLGSAGELAYRASAWGLNINIAKDFDLEEKGDKLRKHLQSWELGLENVLRTHGADDVKSLGGEDIDPGPVIDPNVEAISAQTGIPQSVLKGNETGERSTTQDLKEWYGKIQERREQFVGPVIVRALVDRLIKHGIVDTPEGGPSSYSVEWSPLAEKSEKDISEIQLNRSKVIKNIQSLIPGLDTDAVTEFVEDGEFPDIVVEASPEDVDESDPQVQAYFEERFDGEATPALADGGKEGSD